MNSSFLKGTAIYMISNFFIKIGTILLLPLITRLLTPTEYGIIGILTPFGALINSIFSFGFYVVQNREFFTLKDDKNKLGDLLTTLNTLLLIVFIFLLIFTCSPLSNNFFDLIFAPSIKKLYIIYIILEAMFGIFNNMAISYLRMECRYKYIAIGSILSFLSSNITIIILLLFYHEKIEGRLIGSLIGGIITFIYFYKMYMKNFSFKLDCNIIKPSLRLGIPVVFTAILTNVIDFSDRYIMNQFVDLDIIGQYSLAYTGAGLLYIFISSFNNSWQPHFFQLMKKNKNNKKLEITFVYYIWGLSFICLITQLIAPCVIKFIFSEEYGLTTRFFQLLLPSFLFAAIYHHLENYYYYYKDNKYTAKNVFIVALINLTINLIFVPYFGAYAGIFSTIIAYGISSFLQFVIIKRKYNIIFNYIKIYVPILFVLNPLLFYLMVSNLFIIKIIYCFIYILIFILIIMKKYNTEFKSMIVELYKTGRSVKELSREYGVSEVTIYKWIKQISPITSIDDTDITLEEIKRMKQEMLRLQEENEI